MIKLKVDKIVQRLEKELDEITKKLERRRNDMGEEDGPNQSRYISLSRFALEEELMMMEKRMKEIKEELKELKKIKIEDNLVIVEIKGEKKEFLLTENIEDYRNGIISKNSVIGQKIWNERKKGT